MHTKVTITLMSNSANQWVLIGVAYGSKDDSNAAASPNAHPSKVTTHESWSPGVLSTASRPLNSLRIAFLRGGAVKLIRESLLPSICLLFILQGRGPSNIFQVSVFPDCLLSKFHVPPSPFWECFHIEGTPIQHDAVYATLLLALQQLSQLSDQVLSSIVFPEYAPLLLIT